MKTDQCWMGKGTFSCLDYKPGIHVLFIGGMHYATYHQRGFCRICLFDPMWEAFINFQDQCISCRLLTSRNLPLTALSSPLMWQTLISQGYTTSREWRDQQQGLYEGIWITWKLAVQGCSSSCGHIYTGGLTLRMAANDWWDSAKPIGVIST